MSKRKSFTATVVEAGSELKKSERRAIDQALAWLAKGKVYSAVRQLSGLAEGGLIEAFEPLAPRSRDLPVPTGNLTMSTERVAAQLRMLPGPRVWASHLLADLSEGKSLRLLTPDTWAHPNYAEFFRQPAGEDLECTLVEPRDSSGTVELEHQLQELFDIDVSVLGLRSIDSRMKSPLAAAAIGNAITLRSPDSTVAATSPRFRWLLAQPRPNQHTDPVGRTRPNRARVRCVAASARTWPTT